MRDASGVIGVTPAVISSPEPTADPGDSVLASGYGARGPGRGDGGIGIRVGPLPISIRVASFAVLAMLLGGCTHTRLFSPDTTEGRAEINARTTRRTSTLILAGGEQTQARSLRFDADGATWIESGTDEVRTVALTHVRAIRLEARGRGAREGAAIGLAFGIGFGVLAAAEGGAFDPGPLYWIGTGAGSGAVIGALVGLAVGRTTYIPDAPVATPATLLPDQGQWP